MKRKLLVGAALLLMSVGTASAQTIAQTIEQWGLSGLWAVNCSEPPSVQNGHTSYVAIPHIGAIQARNFGVSQDEAPIIRATVLPDGTIELVTKDKEYNWRFSFEKLGDGKIRVVNSGEDGSNKLTVRDGRFTRNGQPAPTQELCRRR